VRDVCYVPGLYSDRDNTGPFTRTPEQIIEVTYGKRFTAEAPVQSYEPPGDGLDARSRVSLSHQDHGGTLRGFR
jgi:hypothetical protein